MSDPKKKLSMNAGACQMREWRAKNLEWSRACNRERMRIWRQKNRAKWLAARRIKDREAYHADPSKRSEISTRAYVRRKEKQAATEFFIMTAAAAELSQNTNETQTQTETNT